MRQKKNSERQTKVTTKSFVTELRRISQKFGGKSDYLYFCGRKSQIRNNDVRNRNNESISD